MRRLIDIARRLESGVRLRISELDAKDDRGRYFYTPPLTEAQIYAYQEWIVIRKQKLHKADGIAQMLCIVTAPQNVEGLEMQKREEMPEERESAREEAVGDG